MKGGRSKWGSPDCIMPYQHGDFIFSTQWYDEKDIAYVLVRLMPGDLIYIKPGLLYQQISTGFNVIESVDVGSSLWAAASYFFFRCPCDIGQADYVALNIDVYPSITDHYVKAEECSVSECQYITNNKDIMSVHGKSHVHEQVTSVICSFCSKVYCNKKRLADHVYKCHRKGKTYFNRVCEICGVVRHSANFNRHKKSCEAKHGIHTSPNNILGFP